jgi:methyl-accepting chemotaxis protein
MEGPISESTTSLIELQQLERAISAGKLEKRLSVKGCRDEELPARRAINHILDTLIQTYEQAVTSVHGMSIGRIPAPFEDGFPGDFSRAKDVCNHFIDVINRRNTQIQRLTIAAAHGDLHVRTNVEEFTGVNRAIFESFNAMFEAWLAPVNEVERVLTALAKMDLTARVEGSYEGDYQRIASTLNMVCSKLAGEVRQIQENTTVMAAASEELAATTKQLTAGAVESSRLANSAAQATDEVSAGLAAAASGSVELQRSIQEISQNAGKAAAIVQSGVQVTENAGKKMSLLGESSAEIGKVIKVITGIAQQTNLLALNATIEAARAGEAGRGFAVVANEVKELAKGTAKATEEVSKRIATIQKDTKESVAGIAEIAAVTKQISSISATIAAAVEMQSTTTDQAGRHVSAAAAKAAEIAKEMSELAEAARKTRSDAVQIDSAITELNSILHKLQKFVALFTI